VLRFTAEDAARAIAGAAGTPILFASPVIYCNDASAQRVEGTALMTESDRTGTAEGTFSRGAAVKALVVGLAGGLVSRLGLPAPDAEARKRNLNTLWAAFNADGSIVNAKGVDRTQGGSIGTGAYGVFFTRDVSRCALTASINTRQGPGMIAVNPLSGFPKVAEVWTRDGPGNIANQAFSVLVTC
jgi:hypothetical protein